MANLQEQFVTQLNTTFETFLAKWYERDRAIRDYNRFSMVNFPLDYDAEKSTSSLAVFKPFSTVGLANWSVFVINTASTLAATTTVMYVMLPQGIFPISQLTAFSNIVNPYMNGASQSGAFSSSIMGAMFSLQGTFAVTMGSSTPVSNPTNSFGAVVGSKLLTS